MPVSSDIVRTYRGPRRVVRDLLSMGQREDRAIMWLMFGCLIVFISRLPALQREAVMAEGDFTRDAAYAFFGLMMLAPLLFYALAFVGRGIAYLLRGRPSGYGSRVALFWLGLAGRDPGGAVLWVACGVERAGGPGHAGDWRDMAAGLAAVLGIRPDRGLEGGRPCRSVIPTCGHWPG